MTASPAGPRILVVDDEPQIHRFLQPTLHAAGYTVDRADDAAAALRLAGAHPPALVLLDLGLPDLDGQELLVRLRAFCAAPVIVLSARDRAEEKIHALDHGANDYVEKPFDMGELLARIRAALRHEALRHEVGRHEVGRPGQMAAFHAGVLDIDFTRRLISVAGQPVLLSPREYDLLALLARGAGRVVTHRQLLTGVWGPAHVQDVQYLRVYVGHLRQKLGAAAGLLRTEPGVGYRLLEAPPPT